MGQSVLVIAVSSIALRRAKPNPAAGAKTGRIETMKDKTVWLYGWSMRLLGRLHRDRALRLLECGLARRLSQGSALRAIMLTGRPNLEHIHPWSYVCRDDELSLTRTMVLKTEQGTEVRI
jgi:hypothetical protein